MPCTRMDPGEGGSLSFCRQGKGKREEKFPKRKKFFWFWSSRPPPPLFAPPPPPSFFLSLGRKGGVCVFWGAIRLDGWETAARKRRGGFCSGIHEWISPASPFLSHRNRKFFKKSIQAREGEEGGREGVRMEQETEEKSPRL